MVTTEQAELDWTRVPEFREADKCLRDLTAIHEERARECAIMAEWRTSNDELLRARHHAEYAQIEAAANTARAHLIHATRLWAAAERAAKAKVQPEWDRRFRDAWLAVESVVTGPLLEAVTAWEALEQEAKDLTIPHRLPAQWSTTAIPMLLRLAHEALQLEDR